MAITTLEKVKQVLRIQETTKDEYINAIIPLVEEWIKGYTNDDFLAADGVTVVYPLGYELIAIKMIEYNLTTAGLNSESLGDYSISINPDYPLSVVRGLRKKARFL